MEVKGRIGVFVVVSYDVADDRIRNKVAKVMESFGDRVQYSVFECNMDVSELMRMVKKLQRLITSPGDSVRIYRICTSCKRQILIVGSGKVSEDPDLVVV
jgi:CRISPR-associated protein Cas2